MTNEEYKTLDETEWLTGFKEYHFVLRKGKGCVHTLQIHFDIITNTHYWTMTVNTKERFLKNFEIVEFVPQGIEDMKENFLMNDNRHYNFRCECGSC